MKARWVQSRYGSGATLYFVHAGGKTLRYVGGGYHWGSGVFEVSVCGEKLSDTFRDADSAKKRVEEALRCMLGQVITALDEVK